MAFDRDRMKQKAVALAAKGVFIGTSSLEIASGWRGMLYDESRYVYRGKFALSRFGRSNCLTEYAEVFKTGLWTARITNFLMKSILKPASWPRCRRIFLICLQGDGCHVTIKQIFQTCRVSASGPENQNEHFLDAGLFERAFLKSCEPFRRNIGLLMFEFSRFYKSDYEYGRDFVAGLDKFLGGLPTKAGRAPWRCAMTIGCSRIISNVRQRHGVAHVFNSWEAMPPVGDQTAICLSSSTELALILQARFLLKPGRKYAEAVKTFEPYDRVQEPNDDARAAGAKLIAEGEAAAGKKKTFIYVNNRLEGNALETIDAMLERVAAQESLRESNRSDGRAVVRGQSPGQHCHQLHHAETERPS